MKKLILILLKFYKRYLSPKNFGLATCKFIPSCADYTTSAVEKFGIFKGLFLGAKRILKCNPFAKGGYDPVE